MLTYEPGTNNKLNLRLIINGILCGLYIQRRNELVFSSEFLDHFSYNDQTINILLKINQSLAKQVFKICISGCLC